MEGFHAEMRDGALVINGVSQDPITDKSEFMTGDEVAQFCALQDCKSAQSAISKAVRHGEMDEKVFGLHHSGMRGYSRAMVEKWQADRQARWAIRGKRGGYLEQGQRRRAPQKRKKPALTSAYIAERLRIREGRGHLSRMSDLCTALHGAKHWTGFNLAETVFRPAIRAAVDDGTIIERDNYFFSDQARAAAHFMPAPQQLQPQLSPAPDPVAMPAGDDFEAKVAAIRACNQRIASLEQCLIAEKATREKLVNSL